MKRSQAESKGDDNSPLRNAHLSRRRYEQRKKINPFVLLPIYGNKAKLSDTFEKRVEKETWLMIMVALINMRIKTEDI